MFTKINLFRSYISIGILPFLWNTSTKGVFYGISSDEKSLPLTASNDGGLSAGLIDLYFTVRMYSKENSDIFDVYLTN